MAENNSLKEEKLENLQWLLEKYRLLAENSVDCIWKLDKDLRFTYLSPSLERILGFKPEEWIGTTLESHFKAEEYRKVQKLIDEALEDYKNQDYKTINFETKAFNKQNKEIDLEITGKVLLDKDGSLIGLQGTTRDISKRKQTDQALRESEGKYRTMFVNMASANCMNEIVYKNGHAVDYRILDVNPAYEKMHGINREQAIGALASELYSTGEPPFLDIYSKVANSGKPAYFEAFFEPMQEYLYITVGSPKPGFFTVIANNIGKLKRTENELRKLKNSLQTQVDEQTKELQERVAELERFQEAAMDREFRIKELRDEIKRLKSER